MQYAVLGTDEDHTLRRLTFYNPMVATESELCDDLIPSAEFTFDSLNEAADLADRLIQMDRIYWPEIGPVIAKVEAGKVTTLLAPGEMDEFIAKTAERLGLATEVVAPL